MNDDQLAIAEKYRNEMAEKWGISSRRVSLLCAQDRIEGAIKKGKTWLIPAEAKKPIDARLKKKDKIEI